VTRDRRNWGAVKARLVGATGCQGLSLAVAQGVTVLAGLGVGTLLARGLGVEGYGVYVFALTVVQVMLIPLDFGLPTLVMREVAILRTRSDWPLLTGLLRWSAAIVTGVILALAIGTLAWTTFMSGETALYLAAVALAGVWAYMRLAAAVLRGMKHVAWAAMPDQVIRPLTMLAALALISLVGALSPERAMALHTLAAAAGLAWALWMLGRYRPVPPGQAGTARYSGRAWFTSLLPLGMQVGAGFLNARIDVLMLGFLADSRAVGVYGLGIMIGGLAGMPGNIIKQMAAPRIAQFHAQGRTADIQRLTWLSAAVSVAGATTVFLSILVLGKPIVVTIVGPEFGPSVTIAAIMASGSIVTGLWCTAAPLLNMTGQERHTTRGRTAGAFRSPAGVTPST